MRHQWAIPCTTGQETAVCDAIDAIDGAACYAPLSAKIGRAGKSSKPQLLAKSLWPGYVFADMTAPAYHDAKRVKDTHFQWMFVNPREWEDSEGQGIMAGIRWAQEKVDRTKAEYDAGVRTGDFEEQAFFNIVGQRFFDEIASFERGLIRNRRPVWRPTWEFGQPLRVLGGIHSQDTVVFEGVPANGRPGEVKVYHDGWGQVVTMRAENLAAE